MHRESGFVQVALELKPGFLNELVVFRIVGDGWHPTQPVEPAHPLQIHVSEGFGARQQAGGFGRRLLPQFNHHRQGGDDCNHTQNSKASSSPHNLLLLAPPALALGPGQWRNPQTLDTIYKDCKS
jgi:hypothetical protein